MDLTSTYCPDRKNLEERCWILVTRLFSLAGLLLNLVGKDRQAFATTKKECGEVRDDIAESRRRLQDHRSAHGC